MSNYLTTDELRGIINIIDALDVVDNGDVGFTMKLYDTNGDQIGRIERKEAGAVYYPGPEVD